MIGRVPIVFDPVRRASWIALLDSGMTQGEACERVCVSPGTIGKWLRRGRAESEGEYWEFASAVDLIRPRRRKRRPVELVSLMGSGGLSPGDLVVCLEREALGGSVQAMFLLLMRSWE